MDTTTPRNAGRMTRADILFALDWLDTYSAGEFADPLDTANVASRDRVAAFLQAELERRQDQATVRAVARQTGCSLAQAREALARVKAGETKA